MQALLALPYNLICFTFVIKAFFVYPIVRYSSRRHRFKYDTPTRLMSEDEETSSWCCISCCASCGIAAVDDIELKECDGCDLVKYCGDACQQIHKSEHEEECKQRAAELRDELLFKQLESSHMGDCPICMIPLPIDIAKSTMMLCCSKTICMGCAVANVIRENTQSLAHSCPFCRKPAVNTDEEREKMSMKRIEANDPAAMCHQGGIQYKKGDHHKAFDYYTMAAALGDAEAHYNLAVLYQVGHGVEKDMGKEMFHWEKAAIRGHPFARYELGAIEWSNGNMERAVKHLVIAAAQGHDRSIKALMEAFKQGAVEKEDLAAALRAHHAAVDATKSPRRKEAEEVDRRALANRQRAKEFEGAPSNQRRNGK